MCLLIDIGIIGANGNTEVAIGTIGTNDCRSRSGVSGRQWLPMVHIVKLLMDSLVKLRTQPQLMTQTTRFVPDLKTRVQFRSFESDL